MSLERSFSLSAHLIINLIHGFQSAMDGKNTEDALIDTYLTVTSTVKDGTRSLEVLQFLDTLNDFLSTANIVTKLPKFLSAVLQSIGIRFSCRLTSRDPGDSAHNSPTYACQSAPKRLARSGPGTRHGSRSRSEGSIDGLRTEYSIFSLFLTCRSGAR